LREASTERTTGLTSWMRHQGLPRLPDQPDNGRRLRRWIAQHIHEPLVRELYENYVANHPDHRERDEWVADE
jgi:hypothetical protein